MTIDKYTKFILTIIAISLIGIFLKNELISLVYAEEFSLDMSDYSMIQNGLGDIASAIRGCM